MYRNRLNSLLSRAKQYYFSSQLDKERYNMRNTWKILNSILRCPKKVQCQKFVSNNNKTYTEPKEIANKFNDFFCQHWPNISWHNQTPR